MVRDAGERVRVYGADWCGTSVRTLQHLDELGVSYEYVDIDDDRHAAAWVREHNHGNELKPTVEIDGEVLSAPRHYVLDDVLRRHGILQ